MSKRDAKTRGLDFPVTTAEDRNLTDKQRLFVEHYLQTLNATKSAELAGYKGTYSVLGGVGFNNLRKPKIRELIEERLSEFALSSNEVLYRLSLHARADIADFLELNDETGEIEIDLRKAKRLGKLHLIKKIKQTKKVRTFSNDDETIETIETIYTELDLHDVQSALEKLAKYHGLFVDRIESDLTIRGTVPIRIINYGLDVND